MKKVALFAFNGDPMCFIHVLLHAFDMHSKDYEVQIVIEGSACKLVKDYPENPDHPNAKLFRRAKEEGLIGGVCKACASKVGALEAAIEQELHLYDDMMGHPSITAFLEKGYAVFTF
ncbi:MAG: DsrE family protein [Candidatus Lernaella stagnicola]|nr:DsrE family protein [Candidatus Lernaella stagnicola]